MDRVPRKQPLLFLSALLACLSGGAIHADDKVKSYLDLDLEDLLTLEVTSVSKKKQPLSEVAAAVYVITQEDIRRSGVTSIPEALRLAPGVQVAKMDSNKWAITSRGFNAQFANKLLVMIDGRSVYTPSFSGVYWEMQDTMLEDIARIEVIRGPGATVWGANAVNGVINIITKRASETQDTLIVAGAGDEEKAFTSLRYGTELGEGNYGRAYFKYHDRDSSYAPSLEKQAGDDWRSLSAGFRIDGMPTVSNQWTLRGDIFDTDEDQIVNGLFLDPTIPTNQPPFREINVPHDIDTNGWNILARWEQSQSEQSTTTLQFYYDHNEREEVILDQEHDTFDADFQHQVQFGQRHDVVWGLGYRYIESDFDNTFSVSILPKSQTQNLYSAFIQDEIELIEDTLKLTIGSKFEHNRYTGVETQPSARILWIPKDRHTLWASVSRAIRTPSQVEDGSRIVSGVFSVSPFLPPVVLSINGDNDFTSDKLTAYELGYRVQPAETVFFDVALFYNEYENIGTFEMNTPTTLIFDNKRNMYSHGGELAMDWYVAEWWRLHTNYSYLEISEHTESDSTDDFSGEAYEGSSPRHQFSVRSTMDLANDWALDLWGYYVDELKASTLANEDARISDYFSFNARVAWSPTDGVELSVVGQNLLDKRHEEFVGEAFVLPTEVERSIYGKIRLEF